MTYIKHSLYVISSITGCISIFAFISSVGIPTGITSFAIWLKNILITAGTKTYKWINKKKKHDHIVLLAKLIKINYNWN